ncbi:MAG: DUF2334 domain-containing protein [Actinomycetota bacterium]
MSTPPKVCATSSDGRRGGYAGALRRGLIALMAATLSLSGLGAAGAATAPSRVQGVIVDPADYVTRQPNAAALARTLAADLADDGVNTIYLNAYNVEYGAYYRTSYRYSSEAPYGRQDLLGKLINAAHARGIRVFAAFYDHQHRGAWEANPSWRAKTQSQGDYNPPRTDVQFYLSVGRPEAVAWWLGFLRDLLTNYPNLDGIELREPIVNWWGTDADWNPAMTAAFRQAHPGAARGGDEWRAYRAQALTTFMHGEIAAIHKTGRLAHVTTVGSAYESGTLMPATDVARETGFDLDGLLTGADRPDAIKVEIIWQQWARNWGFVTFTPAWTGYATGAFLRQIAGRAPVIVHIELTQFGSHKLTSSEVDETLTLADRTDVAGLDVYSAALADRMGFWPQIRERFLAKGPSLPPQQKGARALVLYDGRGAAPEVSRMFATNLANLLGHFGIAWRVESVEQYHRGDASTYSALFYLGTVYGNVTSAFLTDAASYNGTLVWMGQNLFQLKAEIPGLAISQPSQRADTSFTRIAYGVSVLPATGDLIPTTPLKGATVLAWAQRASGARAPYVLRAGNVWYVAGLPFTTLDTPSGLNGRYLVFSDLLHTMLGIDGERGTRALVRLEGITPLSDPDVLRRQAAVLQGRSIPFALSVIPIWTDGTRTVRLDERPKLTRVLRDLAADGAAVIMNGSSHRYRGTTGDDYEFWDAEAGDGVAEDGDDFVTARVDAGLNAMWKSGLHPVAWQTPFDAATPFDYTAIGEYFTTFVERRTYGTVDEAAFKQAMPFLVGEDAFGARILPENLGVAESAADVGTLVSRARALRAVRDAFAGAGILPSVPAPAVASLADDLKGLGYSFYDLMAEPSSVVGATRAEIVGSGSASITIPNGSTLVEMRMRRDGKVLWRRITHSSSSVRVTRSVSNLPSGVVFILAVRDNVSKSLFPIDLLARTGFWLAAGILALAALGVMSLEVVARRVRSRAGWAGSS